MSTGLTIVEDQQLHTLVGDALLPHLKQVLAAAGTGQRLRVSALPEPVMEHLCRSLQGSADWCARVLTNEADGEAWHATATKLIELRNSLAVPLVVFLPPGLRTAAEDSLDIATFHELPLASLAGVLREKLLAQLPRTLADAVREVLGQLQLEKRVRNDDELIEYLLTIVTNGGTAEAAGGALYCFGLCPDFGLFTRGSTPHWLSRNFRAVEHLTAAQPIHTSVNRLPLKPKTIQKALAAFLRERSPRDVRSWARQIAANEKYRALALDCWEFADEGNEEELRMVVSELALPRQTEDKIGDAAQLRVLNLEGREPLTVSFRSIPPPPQAPGWKSWRVQLIAVREGETAVAWESNNYSKPARQAKVSRKIKLDQLQGLDEGTYFYKVDGYDGDGALITKPHRLGDEVGGRAENESERFLIVATEVPVEERDTRAKYVPSLLDAWTLAASTALGAKQKQPVPDRAQLRGEWDILLGAAPKGEVHFELKTEGVLGYSIVVPAMLRKLQREILEHPEQLGMYSLSFVDARRVADVELKPRSEATLGDEGADSHFLSARKKVFDAISGHHLVDSGADIPSPKARLAVVEVVDLVVHEELITEYADAYVCLCEEAALGSADPAAARAQVRALAQLDVIELRWRACPGDPGRALLVSPTHPLRLLWHLNHARLCAAAVQYWADGTRKAPNFRALLDQILTSVLPINLPMVVFDRRGRGYVEQTPLTQHWSLYLPDRGEQNSQIDAVASRDRLLGHMGIRDRAVSVRTVDPEDVAVRVFDYLTQHPYVEQLKLNVFNPGDGRLVADVLRDLERRRQTDMGSPAPSLRYSVQMFASAEHVEGIGEGLENLLDPERQVAEDDEFTLASSNHLLPKLVFARNTVQDFLEAPKRYSAHVTLLLEQFVVQCRVGRIEQLHQGSYVRGLVQEPETEVEVASGTQFGWLKGLNPRVREGAEAAEQRLVKAVVAAQRVQASYALGGKAETNLAPVVALQLDANGQALLKEVHERSDWVLTLDRNLGLDYFDSPSSSSSTGYLLDFAPEYLQEDRQRILLTTRSTLELEQIVRPVLTHYGLDLREGDPVLVLETLRSLSGRLALRLESGRTQAAEVVGLLLARWLLERLGVLQNRVVIPLDAHRSWFNASDDTSRRRADLLLVGFQEPACLQIDIVEVKLREELPDAARGPLYADMRRQTENTERKLRELFDPELYPGGRADSPMRAKELASALGFYVRRALRYELLHPIEYARALKVLERLDDGYSLDIRALGVVFEHQGRGLHQDEDEPGFVVHRFGGDKARQLLADAAGRLDEKMASSSQRKKRPSSIPPASAERASEAALLTDAELESIRSALTRSAKYPPSKAPPLKLRDSQPPVRSGASLTGLQPTQSPTHADPSASQATVTPPTPRPEDAAPEAGGNGSTPAAQPERQPLPEQSVTQQGTMPSAADPKHRAADVLIGATEFTPQYGILGKRGTDKVAIDLNGCNTISLFGVQGFGKSYTLGVIAEMASRAAPGVNALPSPLATVIFHYHKSDAYEPEYASAVAPNSKGREVERLAQEFGTTPRGLEDVVLLSPEAKVEQRKAEYPSLDVRPIKFASSELGAESWKFLLGAYGNDSLYVRQLVAIMRKHRSALTLDKFREEIESAGLATAARRLADDRLNLAQPYIDDAFMLGELLRPGRTVIVDLRDEWIEKDEALGLFVVMLRIFAATKYEGRQFNKLVVFDEAHKYITESELISQVVETIREMRHQATSVVIASQDPLSVPRAVIELTSIMVLHRMTSPQWLKHLRSGLAALNDVEDGHVNALRPGEALVWAQRSTDPRFSQRPQKVSIRPRFTQHGGGTKTAVEGATVR